jgi:CDP-diacylglycerol---glycerol-3-phosphate 3-phosphatidyltransferase
MTLATQITLCRLGITIAIIPLFYEGTEFGYSATFILFVLAVSSDILDGYIARKLKQVSKIGTYLDALVDKIMIYTLLFSLFYLRIFDPTIVFLMFFRDMIVDGLRNKLHDFSVVYGANIWGKTKFSFQVLAIFLGLIFCIDGERVQLKSLANVLLCCGLIVSLPGLWGITSATIKASSKRVGSSVAARNLSTATDIQT